MPHIVIEVTPHLAESVDFDPVMRVLHERLSGQGYARLIDLKSRVHVTQRALSGMEPEGQFVVARLILTNPRPPEMQHAMGQIIHDVIRDAIEAHARDVWWQCCVFIEPFDRRNYLKTDSRSAVA
jgi:5-carboxymethyl-2-hydroxymuconate isomerase